MKKKSAFLFFFLLIASFAFSVENRSYVQIVAEENIMVFIDDVFRGKTRNEMGGLIIEDVEAGQHRIRCIREGYIPQVSTEIIKPGEVFVYKVRPLLPHINISQSGHMNTQLIKHCTQILKIQSIPIDIQIVIPELDLNSLKNADVWKADNVPCGEYRAEFMWHDKVLDYKIILNADAATHIFVDMLNEKVVQKEKVDSNFTSNVSGTSGMKNLIEFNKKKLCVQGFFFLLGLLFLLLPLVFVYAQLLRFNHEELSVFDYLKRYKHYLSKYKHIHARIYLNQSSIDVALNLSMMTGVFLLIITFFI